MKNYKAILQSSRKKKEILFESESIDSAKTHATKEAEKEKEKSGVYFQVQRVSWVR